MRAGAKPRRHEQLLPIEPYAVARYWHACQSYERTRSIRSDTALGHISYGPGYASVASLKSIDLLVVRAD
ncbi:MAG: hypothetical protein NVS2B4_17910 [Ramlibacter sp.]